MPTDQGDQKQVLLDNWRAAERRAEARAALEDWRLVVVEAMRAFDRALTPIGKIRAVVIAGLAHLASCPWRQVLVEEKLRQERAP